jgi:hypothetical protein
MKIGGIQNLDVRFKCLDAAGFGDNGSTRRRFDLHRLWLLPILEVEREEDHGLN